MRDLLNPMENFVKISSPFVTIQILYTATIVPLFAMYLILQRVFDVDIPGLVGIILSLGMIGLFPLVLLSDHFEDVYGTNYFLEEKDAILYRRPFKEEQRLKNSDILSVRIVKDAGQMKEIHIDHTNGTLSFKRCYISIDDEKMQNMAEFLSEVLGEEKVRIVKL
jgi:hypothetical protein